MGNDENFPPPYDALPDPLKQTILRTYREKTTDNSYFGWELGFKGVNSKSTIADLLKSLDSNGHLGVIKEVYNRCLILPSLWPQIRDILGIWTYEAGAQVSQGFNFTCDAPDMALKLMRSTNLFCEDDPTTAVHGPRDCFRELIKAGPGLHVCIVRLAIVTEQKATLGV